MIWDWKILNIFQFHLLGFIKIISFCFDLIFQTPKHIKDAFTIQIYDEDENNLTLESIKKDQKVICILEVLGIKFTSQSFCIEYCLRQMMVINEMPIFSKCLIKRKPFRGKGNNTQGTRR